MCYYSSSIFQMSTCKCIIPCKFHVIDSFEVNNHSSKTVYSNVYSNVLHHDSLPAYVKKFSNHNFSREEYFNYGVRHRSHDKPAYISYFRDGAISTMEYYVNGRLHRDYDEPAVITYYNNGNIKSMDYFKNGVRHRDHKRPAFIRYHPNGTTSYETFYVNGIVSADDIGILSHKYSSDGNEYVQRFLSNDPCEIVYKDNIMKHCFKNGNVVEYAIDELLCKH